MGTITLTLPVAGQQITAGLHSGNYAALQTLLNGALDNANVSASAAIDLTKLASAAWTAYTPVWASSGTPVALGNSVIVGRYIKIGRLVVFAIKITFGNTATFGTGNYSFTIPVAANVTDPWSSNTPIGTAYAFDSSTSNTAMGFPGLLSSTAIHILYPNTWPTGSQSAWAQTAPFAWDDPDTIQITGHYESAA